MFNAPPLTLWSCGILIAIHAVLAVAPPNWTATAWALFAVSPAHVIAENMAGQISWHNILTLVSYAFLHGDWLHLTVNVGFLLAFGSVVERRFGSFWFAVFYVVCAIAGALAQLAVSTIHSGIIIGASASVYGMMGGVLALMLRGTGPSRRGGFTFIMVIMALNVVIGMLSGATDIFGAVIAWQAHIGGFAAGLALGWGLSYLVAPRGWRR